MMSSRNVIDSINRNEYISKIVLSAMQLSPNHKALLMDSIVAAETIYKDLATIKKHLRIRIDEEEIKLLMDIMKTNDKNDPERK